jgi:hypothetical protein
VGTAVVAPELVLPEASAQTLGETDELEVAAQQLQPAVGSKLFTTKFDRKIPLDQPPQPPYLQPHLWGLPCRVELRGLRTLYNAREALFLQSVDLYGKNVFSL